jgi:hypothetical protein
MRAYVSPNPGTGLPQYSHPAYARRFARATSAQYARSRGHRWHLTTRSFKTASVNILPPCYAARVCETKLDASAIRNRDAQTLNNGSKLHPITPRLRIFSSHLRTIRGRLRSISKPPPPPKVAPNLSQSHAIVIKQCLFLLK